MHARQAASGERPLLRYYATAATYMAWEAAQLNAISTTSACAPEGNQGKQQGEKRVGTQAGDQRAALARLIVSHKLMPRDPLQLEPAVNAIDEAAALGF